MCFVLIDKKMEFDKISIRICKHRSPGENVFNQKNWHKTCPVTYSDPVVSVQTLINLCSYQQIQATYNELNPGLIEDNG